MKGGMELLFARRRQLSEVGRYAFPWLVKLSREVKAGDHFPLFLTDYYQTKEDVEVAGLIDLIIPQGRLRINKITEIRNLIGASPWKSVCDRSFVRYYTPDGGLENAVGGDMFFSRHRLTTLMDWIWQVLNEAGISLEQAIINELEGNNVLWDSLFDIIGRSENAKENMRFLLARMTARDGMGRGIWTKTKIRDLCCPCTAKTASYLRNFYKLEAISHENIDEILQYIGFRIPFDFYYTCLGLDIMKKTNKRNTERFLKAFRSHILLDSLLEYCSGGTKYRKILRNEIPNIKLN